ncbi:hypothetical protein B14911_14672 [Bacillus sp. NRRL B-14911]|nr:hypothetical protein B14911_14672 [Bacillus sp. NRRL B-14911]
MRQLPQSGKLLFSLNEPPPPETFPSLTRMIKRGMSAQPKL